ncbi:MAG TPA: hypothetical protein VIV66_11650 [Pyrinomonadaceae bacterium]
MFRKSTSAILKATGELFRQWRVLTIMIAIYASLLIVMYLGVSIRESTSTQVGLTIALTLATPLLFFTLQMVVASCASPEFTQHSVVKSVLNSWKLLVISLPVIIATVLVLYLLNKLQAHFVTTVTAPIDPYIPIGTAQTPKSINWTAVTLNSLRYLFLGVLTPLALIQLWISASREGLAGTLQRFLNHLGQIINPGALLIYVTGFVIFGLIPYLLLFKTTFNTRPWLEISLFGTRLLAAFLLSLFGWTITVRALAMERSSSAAKAT